MSTDGKDQGNMEIFKPGQGPVERQLPFSPGYPAQWEKSPDLFAWWAIVRKRKWTIVFAFALLFGIVLAGSLRQKPEFRAKSLIEIDKESPSVLTPQDLFQAGEVSDDYLETQYKVLTSDDLAGRVIRQLELEKVPEFRHTLLPWSHLEFGGHFGPSIPSDQNGSPAASDSELRELVLSSFHEHLDIRPIRRSRAVEIRFDSKDPELAARIVNATVDNYIQKNLEARWDSAQKTSAWLTQQLQDLKIKLEKSEEDLQKYATENGLLFLDTDKGSGENVLNQSVRDLQAELNRAQGDRMEKESLFRLVQSGDYGSLPGVVDNRLLQDLSEHLADLQRQHAQLAATFTEEYPKVKEIRSQIADVQSSLDSERSRAARKISNEYVAALRREKLVEQAFKQKQDQANQFAEKSVQYGILSREVDTNKGLYDGLLQRLKEAGVSAGLKASNIRIVDPGTASYRPVSPDLPLNLGLATFAGLALGISIAFFRESLDQTIRDSTDVDLFLGIPVLGFVPAVHLLNGAKINRKSIAQRPLHIGLPGFQSGPNGGKYTDGRSKSDLLTLKQTPFSESFRELRTSVILSGQGRSANSILVTSAQPGEGKTTVALNLAVSLAQLGQPILLIDADLRCPSLGKYFPGENSQLSQYLAGRGSWQEMVRPTSINNLCVLHGGAEPENSSELLSSERMRALLREAIATYRFVILDSPPLLKGADSRILGSMVGATILVVKGNETPRQVVQFAQSQVRSVGANLIGVVLNRLDVSSNRFAYHAFSRVRHIPSAT